METGEKGLLYQTSRIAYMSNYFLIALLVFLLLLIAQFITIEFSLFPRTPNQFSTTMLVFMFLLFIVYLIEEPMIVRLFNSYYVTNHEVVAVLGLVRKRKTAIPYSSLADVSYKKSFAGRMLNYGDVEVKGFNETIVMKGVRNPEEIYKVITNKLSLYGGHHKQKSSSEKTVIKVKEKKENK
jgi:membrane protein YdbS with pleckstrin-like domain